MIHWPFCKSLKAYYKRDFKPYIVADMLKSYITFRFPFLKDEPMSKELPLTLIPITYEANSPSQEWSFVQFLSLPWLYHFLLLCYGNEVCERTWSPLFALIFRTERHTVPAGTRTADLLVAALHQPSSPHMAKDWLLTTFGDVQTDSLMDGQSWNSTLTEMFQHTNLLPSLKSLGAILLAVSCSQELEMDRRTDWWTDSRNSNSSEIF